MLVFIFGRLYFWSFSFVVVFICGRLLFWSSFFLDVFISGRLHFWSSSFWVVFICGRLHFWSPILGEAVFILVEVFFISGEVIFHFCWGGLPVLVLYTSEHYFYEKHAGLTLPCQSSLVWIWLGLGCDNLLLYVNKFVQAMSWMFVRCNLIRISIIEM